MRTSTLGSKGRTRGEIRGRIDREVRVVKELGLYRGGKSKREFQGEADQAGRMKYLKKRVSVIQRSMLDPKCTDDHQ